MPQTVGSTPPELFFRISASTAKKTLVKVVGAGDYLLVDYTVEFDNATVPPMALLSPTTAAPQVTTIPDSFASSAAGYDQTSPTIQGPQDLVTKVNQALRKAESWGWIKALSNIKRIAVGKLKAKAFLFLVNLNPFGGQYPAVSPPELFSGESGVVFLDEKLVRDYDPASPNEYWLLPRLLIHESLHHAYYTAGYTVTIFPGSPIGELAAYTNFLAHTLVQHHHGTTLASTVNAATLGLQMVNDPGTWQSPGLDVILPHDITGDPHVEPDLRAKSVLDTTQQPHQGFGTRLDSMETIMGFWGIGGWINQFCPPLNYTTSGVAPASDELVLDLNQTDGFLAWQIVFRAMVRTVDKWAEYKKLNPTPMIKARAVSMGMIALMAKLGLIPKK